MKYFLKTYDTFTKFQKNLAKSLINNSYINDKTCDSLINTIKIRYHTYWILRLPMLLTIFFKVLHRKI